MPPAVWAAAGVCVLAVVRAAAAGPRPLRSLLSGALCGLAALAAVALAAPLTGVVLPLNPFTGFVAGVLGLPGVVALLVVPLLL